MEDKEIKALVSASLHTKIIQAFNEAPEAIDMLVSAAISEEVNEHGERPDFHSKRRMPYLEWLVGETIRRIARDAVIETVENRRDEIKAAVSRAVTADSFVDGLTGKLLGTISEEWRVSITFKDESQ